MEVEIQEQTAGPGVAIEVNKEVVVDTTTSQAIPEVTADEIIEPKE